MDPRIAIELIQRYNADPRNFTDAEAEMVAQLAAMLGMPFPRENKPIRKGLFDLVDTMSFGMVPNEWRPESRGQTAFGETGLDRFAGGAGTVAGVGGAIGGALLAGPAALAGAGRLAGAGMRGAAGLGRAGMRAAAPMAQAAGRMARGARGMMPGAGQVGAAAGAYGQNLAQMLRNLRQQMAGGWRQGWGGGPGMGQQMNIPF